MKIRNILYADEGKTLTDGQHYGKVIYLAENENADKWHEIDDGEVPRQEDLPTEGE